MHFEGYPDSGCPEGAAHDCSVVVSGTTHFSARFEDRYRVAFVTSRQTFPSDLGGFQPYDLACNVLATDAGINNTTNDGFVAWLSTSDAGVLTRLNPSPFDFGGSIIRPDGELFVSAGLPDLRASLIHHPLNVDERGAVHVATGPSVLTGTLYTGVTASNATCNDYTTTSPTAHIALGDLGGGPGAWSIYNPFTTCGSTNALFCFQKSGGGGLKLPPTAVQGGKRIYVLNRNEVAATAAIIKTRCPSLYGRPCFATTSTRLASAALDPNQKYYNTRWDLIGTGAEVAAGRWRTGAWFDDTGAPFPYPRIAVIGGGATPSTPVAASDICADWTSTSGTTTGLGTVTSLSSYFSNVTWNLATSATPAPCSGFTDGYTAYVVDP
ncbi:MAG: hypothetical protein IPJ65_43275 [Archangiaceae bacterium]|nr:hypothetical protein [Archangiaceae bacterium]